MPWALIVQLIVSLMQLAEKILPEKGEGFQKKELVTESAKFIVDTMATVSTGGQKETWERIAEPVSKIIDETAGLLFPPLDKRQDI